MGSRLQGLAILAHENSRDHGFWDDAPAVGSDAYATYLGNKLMLIVGEVAEAHEELRKDTNPKQIYYREDGKPEGFLFELTDVLIRLMDLYGSLGIDPQTLVTVKMDYNASRPAKHGKNF